MRFSQSIALALSLATSTLAQPQPQCLSSTNGTTFNGTAGSELQLNGTTIRIFDAPDADQGVAVDEEHFYSIDNYSITKHNKTTGTPLLQWRGVPSGPIIHLDGGVVINGTLYAPHSNYPSSPITSSIEIWNATTLEHIGTHPFGIERGSLTWIDQDPISGVWHGAFANYDRVMQGQMLPYGLTMRTQVVRFGEGWRVDAGWIFPEELWGGFSPMSNSGGSFGPDGWLYLTGHDASEAYVVKIPDAGSTLIWVATISLPDIEGQGIAWDRSFGRNGSLWGVSREGGKVVEMHAALQNCSWSVPTTIGSVRGMGEFEY